MWVFRADLKDERVDMSLMLEGREFQRVGAAKEKEVCRRLIQEVGTAGPEGPGGHVALEEAGDVGGGKIIEGLVGEEKNFEVDSMADW